jgi:hypothetical protein
VRVLRSSHEWWSGTESGSHFQKKQKGSTFSFTSRWVGRHGVSPMGWRLIGGGWSLSQWLLKQPCFRGVLAVSQPSRSCILESSASVFDARIVPMMAGFVPPDRERKSTLTNRSRGFAGCLSIQRGLSEWGAPSRPREWVSLSVIGVSVGRRVKGRARCPGLSARDKRG